MLRKFLCLLTTFWGSLQKMCEHQLINSPEFLLPDIIITPQKLPIILAPLLKVFSRLSYDET